MISPSVAVGAARIQDDRASCSRRRLVAVFQRGQRGADALVVALAPHAAEPVEVDALLGRVDVERGDFELARPSRSR